MRESIVYQAFFGRVVDLLGLPIRDLVFQLTYDFYVSNCLMLVIDLHMIWP